MLNENEQQHPLRSVHTGSLNGILKKAGISLLVSTYQAGKLIVVRSEDNIVNTHFKQFPKPMGMCRSAQGFTLGAGATIFNFRNVPSSANQIESETAHDAVYIPTDIHVTGDIDIHEMGYDKNGELWFVNTKFSCLCTKDSYNNFLPKWRPPFITGYDTTDRCHLNGLGFREGKPRYVTTLGQSDKPMGWRENKAFGGTLIDIETNEILTDGLSMPHSPRYYQDKLYFLESGRGNLSYYDFEKKEVVEVAKLGGFTRGIDFYGELAFIGLSKVRESAVFSGIPLTQEVSERICGVWVVNIKSGEILGFLKFEEGVQEIFAVTVVPYDYPEVIEFGDPLMASSYVIPTESLSDVVHEHKDLDFALPIFEEGNNLFNEGKKEEAIKKYQEALTIQPDYFPAKYNMGIALSDLEKFDEAKAVLQEVLSLDAGHVEAMNALAFIFQHEKNYKEAIKMYEKAIKVAPKYQLAQQNLENLKKLQKEEENEK